MSRLVLVLGCHRSGTSLVTASLPCLGVSLGDRLQAPARDNPKGFHEDLDFQAINEELLQSVGASWDTLSPIDLKPATPNETVRTILADRVSRFPLFGLKDPRFCRTLPFWTPIFQQAGLKVSCVVVLRHPSEVMLSLHTRNGFSEVKGFSLWLVNMLSVMTEKDPEWPFVVVDYDNMMIQPRRELDRIGGALDLVASEEKTSLFFERIHDPSLRHQGRQQGETGHGLVNRVYDELLKLSRDDIDPFHAGKFMAMRMELDKMARLLEGLDAATDQGRMATRQAMQEGMFKWPV